MNTEVAQGGCLSSLEHNALVADLKKRDQTGSS